MAHVVLHTPYFVLHSVPFTIRSKHATMGNRKPQGGAYSLVQDLRRDIVPYHLGYSAVCNIITVII
jgi:hypothetical protein